MQLAVFNVRCKSLLRGTLVVVLSLVLSVVLSGFPEIHPSLLLLLPTMAAVYGTCETVRCLRQRWDFYHGGVMLLLYADVLALALIIFLLLYPYAQWLQST